MTVIQLHNVCKMPKAARFYIHPTPTNNFFDFVIHLCMFMTNISHSLTNDSLRIVRQPKPTVINRFIYAVILYLLNFR